MPKGSKRYLGKKRFLAQDKRQKVLGYKKNLDTLLMIDT